MEHSLEKDLLGNKMGTRISIVNANDYSSIPEAVIVAVKLIENDLHFDLKSAEYILIKPNLISSNRDACTQPGFVEGVIDYLIKVGVEADKIKIGDSPGQEQKNAAFIAKKIGLHDLCLNRGVEFVDFEGEVPAKETIEESVIMKDFYVSKPVKDCDVLINLPRLKTHAVTTITGAIKNYYGIIPGGLKAKKHVLGKNAEEFGEVLADNFSWVVKNKPNRLTVYDLHTIMEGPKGHISGKMLRWNLILAGTDELALDLVALEIGKFNGLKHVPHLKSIFNRGLGIGNPEDIEITGMSLSDAKKITTKFKPPAGFMTRTISCITGNMVFKMYKKMPVLNPRICKKCGDCSQICPVNVIKFEKKHYPLFTVKGCISCLCCMEMCTYNAINTKYRGAMGLFDKT